MNVWKIVCATLVIFVAGIVTGVVLVRLGERGPRPWHRIPREVVNRPQTNLNVVTPNHLNPEAGRPQPNGGGPNAPANRDREFLQLLERQIQLTPEQRGRIVEIMGAGQERIRQMRQSIEPDIRKEMQKTHEQIQALLTPEQREQFQRLMRQRLQRRNDPANQPADRPLLREFRENRRNPPPRDLPGGEPPGNLPPPPEPQPEPPNP